MFLFERNPRSTIKKGRKAPKTTVVCCRTSDALKAEVDALCRRNNLTTSELVKNFIEECVKRDSTTWWEGIGMEGRGSAAFSGEEQRY